MQSCKLIQRCWRQTQSLQQLTGEWGRWGCRTNAISCRTEVRITGPVLQTVPGAGCYLLWCLSSGLFYSESFNGFPGEHLFGWPKAGGSMNPLEALFNLLVRGREIHSHHQGDRDICKAENWISEDTNWHFWIMPRQTTITGMWWVCQRHLWCDSLRKAESSSLLLIRNLSQALEKGEEVLKE